jgi:hypothetical protein
MATMGERFTLYRLVQANGSAAALHAMNRDGREIAMRQALSGVVAEFFASLPLPEHPYQMSDAEKQRLVALAEFAARGRSAVERDAHTREILQIYSPEVPVRLALQLIRLLAGLRAVGTPEASQWRIVTKVAEDCIPALRLAVIRALLRSNTLMKTVEVAIAVRHPTSTTKRALEDLHAHDLVVRHDKSSQKVADLWRISEWTQEHVRRAMMIEPCSTCGSYDLEVVNQRLVCLDCFKRDQRTAGRGSGL